MSVEQAIDCESEFGLDVRALSPAAGDAQEVRTVFARYPAAVGALCATVDGEPVGLVATSLAVGISYDPPMVTFSVRKKSTTWPTLRRAPRIGVSVLGQGQKGLVRQLAGPASERFAECATHETAQGALFLPGAMSWLDCTMVGEIEVGDHLVVILELVEVGHDHATAPLIYHDRKVHLLAEHP